jgi:hypothetical protein
LELADPTAAIGHPFSTRGEPPGDLEIAVLDDDFYSTATPDSVALIRGPGPRGVYCELRVNISLALAMVRGKGHVPID